MRRTTTRRAASAGLGALAATAALALAAPSAVAATTPVVLEPSADGTFASLLGFPTDEELLETLFDEGVLPVPESPDGEADGEVVLTLPDGVEVAEDVAASFLSPEDAFAIEFGEEPEGDPLLTSEPDGGLGVVVDGDVLTVGFSVEALAAVDRDRLEDGVGVLVLEGVGLGAVPDLPLSTSVALDTTPSTVYAGPLELQGISVVAGFLDDTFSVEAGSALELQVPDAGLLDSLGLDLTTAQISLYDLEGLDDVDADAVEEGAAAAGVRELRALAEDEDPAEDDPSADDDLGLVDLDVDVADDGASASAAVPAGTAEGDYALDVSFFDAPFEAVEQGDFSALGLVASIGADVEVTAVPVPTPTVTVTQPGPTATVTAAPPRQNPGLRSNTGVEEAAPGLSDGALVLLGSGLLAVAGVTAAAGVRSSRRARG